VRFDVLTLFPDFFLSPLKISLLGKAIEAGKLSVFLHDIRQWATDKHRTVDDLPYGGGPGMVMKPEPLVAALEAVRDSSLKGRRIYLSPKGRHLRQQDLKGYLNWEQIVLLCGRYEGIDQRVIDHSIDEEVSVGDYVLAGGEAAALVFIEAVTRLIPGVLGNEGSLEEESFTTGSLIEYPHYTRPEEFRGLRVPEVLLSGDHQKIREWRRLESDRLLKSRK